MIILETIASSLPIISSNYPVYKEILERNTIYFDPDNPHDIGSLIKKKFRNTKNMFKNYKKIHLENFI